MQLPSPTSLAAQNLFTSVKSDKRRWVKLFYFERGFRKQLRRGTGCTVSTPSSCGAKGFANARVMSSLLSGAVPRNEATSYCRAPPYCRAQVLFCFQRSKANCAWFVFGRACVYVRFVETTIDPLRADGVRRRCTGAVSDLRSENKR